MAVQRWFAENKPSVVVLAAAKVGGIHANNTYPADFLLENLKIEINVIETAHRSGVRRLLFLGSSCIYPKFAEQPSVRNLFWRVFWSRPMSGMPSPRSVGSSSAKPCANSMVLMPSA